MKAKDKRQLTIFIIAVMVFIIIGSYFKKVDACNLRKSSVFVVATTIKHINSRISNIIEVDFYFDGVWFKKELSYDGEAPKIGKKYFILIDKNNINKSIVFENCPVPENFNYYMLDWKKMPIESYQKYVNSYFDKYTNSGLYLILPNCE